MLDKPCCLWYNIRGEYFFFFFFFRQNAKNVQKSYKNKKFLKFPAAFYLTETGFRVILFFQGQTDRGRRRNVAAAAALMTRYRVNEKNFMRKSICGSGER